MVRANILAAVFVAVGAGFALSGCGDDDGATPSATLSGYAVPFHMGPDGRIEGAEVWILESPERRVVTGADGYFAFDGLGLGEEVTLVLDHPDYVPIQTGTIELGPEGAERVTFQAVVRPIYNALAATVRTTPDPTKCQMVTTVTRVGKSILDAGAHGEAGATVTLEPPLTPQQGPIYFNAQVIPNRSLTETSDDGGVLFVNVEPGEYVWTAHKEGVAFTQVKMKCRPGMLVNASPPWGLQAR